MSLYYKNGLLRMQQWVNCFFLSGCSIGKLKGISSSFLDRSWYSKDGGFYEETRVWRLNCLGEEGLQVMHALLVKEDSNDMGHRICPFPGNPTLALISIVTLAYRGGIHNVVYMISRP
ncbi:unnamed protein product [Absidia cylindrospora]